MSSHAVQRRAYKPSSHPWYTSSLEVPASLAPVPQVPQFIMHAAALFSFLSLALIAFAEPITIRDSTITFPIAKRVNATGIAGLAQRDKLRAQFLKNKSQMGLKQASSVGSIPATNQAVDYVAMVRHLCFRMIYLMSQFLFFQTIGSDRLSCDQMYVTLRFSSFYYLNIVCS
jgi:hypothetical protein